MDFVNHFWNGNLFWTACTLLRPRYKFSCVQYLIVDIEGAEFPQTSFSSVLISSFFSIFKNKYLITARYSILFVFVKMFSMTIKRKLNDAADWKF